MNCLGDTTLAGEGEEIRGHFCEGSTPMEVDMTSVLGIDAAWTSKNPSGVALVRSQPGLGWECIALAPSYEDFINLADEDAVGWAQPDNWEKPTRGGVPEPARLLKAAEKLLSGERVSVVSVDMPLANTPITGRRECDNAVSRKFAKKGCGTHSPINGRPGEISGQMRESLVGLGYSLEVSKPDEGTVIEVYPHPALLSLLNRDYRVPYKVSRSLKYWPSLSVQERADHLVGEFKSIYAGVSSELHGLPCEFLPSPPYKSLSFLKRYEDALDALVCAWVGTSYLEGRADHYGDADAAIWIP